jgi:hypothetical protein
MKNSRLVLLACVFLYLSASVVFSRPPQEADPANPKAKGARRSLVRKDLLEREAEPLQPPLRNIFAPQRPGLQRDGSGLTGIDDPDEISDEDTPEGDAADEEFAVVLDLRYIGYIRSSERTVAVIIFEGEATAVKTGDLVSEGVTIMKITPEEIVYQGPDAVSRTVSLEGEDR